MKNENFTVQMNHYLDLLFKNRDVKIFGHIITNFQEILPITLIMESYKSEVLLSIEITDVNISHLKHPFSSDFRIIHTDGNRGTITVTEHNEYVNIHDAFKVTQTFQSMLNVMLPLVQAPPSTLDDLGLSLDESKNYKAMLLDDIQKHFRNISFEDEEYVLIADSDDVNLELHVKLKEEGFTVYPLFYPYNSEPHHHNSPFNIIIKIEPDIDTRSLSFEPMSYSFTNKIKNYEFFLETSKSLIELLMQVANHQAEKSFKDFFMK